MNMRLSFLTKVSLFTQYANKVFRQEKMSYAKANNTWHKPLFCLAARCRTDEVKSREDMQFASLSRFCVDVFVNLVLYVLKVFVGSKRHCREIVCREQLTAKLLRKLFERPYARRRCATAT